MHREALVGDHLRTNLASFIDEYSNGTRLDWALGYQPPNEFERARVRAAVGYRPHAVFQARTGITPGREVP